MINRILTRGASTGGLVRYLFGPGRDNEHVDQRVIAAADTLGLPEGIRLDPVADRQQIIELGRQLDSHRKAYGVQLDGGHVWHCAISLPRGERLSDPQWAQVARSAVEQLGFTGGPGRAPCRWVAVHHGPSDEGNDHIHLAVNLVREDGTTATNWRDWPTMSRLCAAMERRFALSVVEGRPGTGMPGYTRAEAERAHRAGGPEPDRLTLARLVRATATASASEAEWLQRLHNAGVLTRPRRAAGNRGEVTGYSVALPDTRPIWFGGGRLAADLTLPRLRQRHWPAPPPDDGSDAAREPVAAAWHATTEQPPSTYGAAAWRHAAAYLDQLHHTLAATPGSDTATWTTTSGMAAGVLAALSTRIESTPAVLAQTADMLARAAQTRPSDRPATSPRIDPSMRTIARIATQAALPPHNRQAWHYPLRHLANLVMLIGRKIARRQPQLAANLRARARRCLAVLKPRRTTGTGAPSADLEFPHPLTPGPTQPTATRPPRGTGSSTLHRKRLPP